MIQQEWQATGGCWIIRHGQCAPRSLTDYVGLDRVASGVTLSRIRVIGTLGMKQDCNSASDNAMRHEAAFIQAFVRRDLRNRYRTLLSNPKKRGKITNRFCHEFDFVRHLAEQIERVPNCSNLLKECGAGPSAVLIGGTNEIDGREFTLEAAVERAMGYGGGVIVSCIPGRLALLIQEFPPGDLFLFLATD